MAQDTHVGTKSNQSRTNCTVTLVVAMLQCESLLAAELETEHAGTLRVRS